MGLVIEEKSSPSLANDDLCRVGSHIRQSQRSMHSHLSARPTRSVSCSELTCDSRLSSFSSTSSSSSSSSYFSSSYPSKSTSFFTQLSQNNSCN
ncbi:unnamed protein product [Trichobilharzia regenti]|nr:unnamed protein product [Trichobilharzia regenti]